MLVYRTFEELSAIMQTVESNIRLTTTHLSVDGSITFKISPGIKELQKKATGCFEKWNSRAGGIPTRDAALLTLAVTMFEQVKLSLDRQIIGFIRKKYLPFFLKKLRHMGVDADLVFWRKEIFATINQLADQVNRQPFDCNAAAERFYEIYEEISELEAAQGDREIQRALARQLTPAKRSVVI